MRKFKCRSGLFHILAGLVVSAGLAHGFHGAIEGRVFGQDGRPLAGAQVWLDGYSAGAATDSAGRYFIEVPMHGGFTVVYQYIGYESETLRVMVHHGERVFREVRLRQKAISMPGVETRARQDVLHESRTPEPTAVIPGRAAEQAGKSTIGEAATLSPGVQLQKRCSACEASEVSIQGLPGRFSLILLEGLPVFTNLASRYVLDMLPVDFLDRLDVLKGAAGAIWGSDAIAGAVNIRLLQPARPFEAKGAYTLRSHGNEMSAFAGGNISHWNASVIGARSRRGFVDLNRDGISENTAYSRNVVLANSDYHPGLNWRFVLGGSYGDETRRSGAMVHDSLYYRYPQAEKVRTRRWDIWQRTGFMSGSSELGLSLAASNHTESGIVETRDYSAHQSILYGELSGLLPPVRSGVSVLRRNLSDTRLFGDGYEEGNLGIWAAGQSIPLRFLPVGNEVLPALRLDLNSEYGTILSPYFAMNLYPGWVDLNLAVGTGFRTPSVIFESMENLPAGYQYAVRRDSNLSHESGTSVQLGAARTVLVGSSVANLRLALFHHRVTNFIAADLVGLDTTSLRALFYYHNLPGATLSTGAELSAGFVLPRDISVTLSGHILSPRTADNQSLSFIRRWAAGYSAAYRPKGVGLELSLAGELNGPMQVQTVREGGVVEVHESPVYSVLNLRLAQELKVLRLALGVNNLWDYHQPPLTHHGGTTEYYWGPIIGRELYLNATVGI